MPTPEIKDVFPYLRVRDAMAAIQFYREAFGAEELFRLTERNGRVGHAELKFGEYVIMVSDEYPEYGILGPSDSHPPGSAIHLHVAHCDETTKRAEESGAKVTMHPTDMFYGERVSKLIDPFGHEWMIGSQIEEVDPEEMQRRFDEMTADTKASDTTSE